jgi:phytoene desaturase
MAKSVIVIGAGIGGLSASIRLAAAGQRVTVFEKNPIVGGKMNELRSNGFRWDTGPSVITMRHVFEELFTTAGKRLGDYLELVAVDPLTRYFYPDGTVLDASRELARMVEQIERIEPRDVEGYLSYLAYAARLHRITGPVFIYDQPPSLNSFTKVAPLDAFKIDPLRTMNQAIEGFVRSPHLRQLLGRFATYVGASPYQAPATLNVIAHVELNGGVWYPKGGIYAIARALEKLARELGVTIHTNCPVQQIVIEQRKVAGVIDATGQCHTSDAVIANVDVTSVYEHLIPPEHTPHQQIKRLRALEPSCSGFIMMLGLKGTSPTLAHHNIFFSRDYRAEFDDIFRRGIPPADPTVYVAITSKADPHDAPPDHENWFVLVNAPALGPQWTWDERSTREYGERVLDMLAAHGIDIRPRLIESHIWTPVDIERLSAARRGALYGASSNNRFAAFLRPRNQSSVFQNLYFAGGTTHPGGGVPMVTLSGKVAADLINR